MLKKYINFKNDMNFINKQKEFLREWLDNNPDDLEAWSIYIDYVHEAYWKRKSNKIFNLLYRTRKNR